MTELIQFDFDGHPVRMPTTDPPTWVAADIRDALGFVDNMPWRTLPPHYKDTVSVRTPGGPQEMTVLTEPGLYRMIFRSDLPDAEPFRQKVCEDVLPSIRKYGCYPPPTLIEPDNTTIIVAVRDMLMPFIERIEKVEDSLVQMISIVRTHQEEFRDSQREKRKELTPQTKERHIKCISAIGGMCPSCSRLPIVENGKRIPHMLQFDHFFLRSMNRVWETWPVCCECNTRLRRSREDEGKFWIESTDAFGVYQRRRWTFEGGRQLSFFDDDK